MSPEQAGGGSEIDGRSDLYSLGCVLYEMLAGEPPFVGPTPQAVMAKQVVAPPPPIISRRSDVPEPVERVLAKALAKEPGDRFAIGGRVRFGARGHRVPRPRETRPVQRRTIALVGLGAAVATALLFALGVSDRRERPRETPRIAVLPFQNLGAPEDGYFSDGITEEITSRLVTIPGLGVISRTSAEQYRESKKSVKEIGRELGVDYILEGGVRWQRVGGSSRVRVTPQLIRVSDDRHLWAGRYDETIEEVFQVQSRIAEQVATALDMALQEPEHEALAARPTDDLRAYDFYLRGNDHFDRPTPEATRAAEEMYTRATELDPTFALAFARLARIYISQFHFAERTPATARPGPPRRRFRPAAQPNLAEAHLALGQIHYWGELDYEAALREFRIAHAADPGNGDLAWARGLVERRLGQWDQAIADLRRALELDPDRASRVSICSKCISGGGSTPRRRDTSLGSWSWSPIHRSTSTRRSCSSRGTATSRARRGHQGGNQQSRRGGYGHLDSAGRSRSRAVEQAGQHHASGGGPGRHRACSAPIRRRTIWGKPQARRYQGDTRAARRTSTRRPWCWKEGAVRAARRPRASRQPGFGVCGPGPSRARHPGGPARGRAEPALEGHVVGRGHGPQPGGGVRHAGRGDSAVQQLRLLLTVPSWISVPGLGVDPTWDPIRRDPGWALLAGQRTGGRVCDRAAIP